MYNTPAVRARTPGLLTTRDIVRAAPESAAMRRRRRRADHRAVQELQEQVERERLESSKYHHRRPYDRTQPGSRLHSRLSSHTPGPEHINPDSTLYQLTEEMTKTRSVGARDESHIELMTIALDQRPSVPYLVSPSYCKMNVF